MHYALPMILTIGFRVKGVRGTQFRQWANRHLQDYINKGLS
ncbi:RhuM family protein [Methyloprofundus sp.]